MSCRCSIIVVDVVVLVVVLPVVIAIVAFVVIHVVVVFLFLSIVIGGSFVGGDVFAVFVVTVRCYQCYCLLLFRFVWQLIFVSFLVVARWSWWA